MFLNKLEKKKYVGSVQKSVENWEEKRRRGRRGKNKVDSFNPLKELLEDLDVEYGENFIRQKL